MLYAVIGVAIGGLVCHVFVLCADMETSRPSIAVSKKDLALLAGLVIGGGIGLGFATSAFCAGTRIMNQWL